jgi:ABC-type transport system involved in cytochrome c biogenesis ATPase subunit
VLRRIFEPKRDEVAGDYRKLHNGELHNLYSSPDIIRQIKSRRTRWVGHVACIREERKVEECTRFWCESLKERGHSKDQGIDGRMG